MAIIAVDFDGTCVTHEYPNVVDIFVEPKQQVGIIKNTITILKSGETFID